MPRWRVRRVRRAGFGPSVAGAVSRGVWPAPYVAVAVGAADRIEAPIRALGLGEVRRIEAAEAILG